MDILDVTTAVYVSKLNRIYIFGGRRFGTSRYMYHKNIWYIDLPTPPPPALPNCSILPNGNYVHTSNASSFIVCRNGSRFGVFNCPRSLLFDPNLRSCNAPEHIIPNLSCEGKTGPYAYPADSTKFILCRRPSVLVDVYDCPKPLQFDPTARACAVIESVAAIS
jgi:hypothetical protein